MSDEIDLGLRLLVAVRKTGRTQRDIAKAVGITPKHMSQLVNGGAKLLQAKADLVLSLAEQLEVTMEWLLGRGEAVDHFIEAEETETEFEPADAALVGA